MLQNRPLFAAKVRSISFHLAGSLEDAADESALYYRDGEMEEDEENDPDAAIDWAYKAIVANMAPLLDVIVGACSALAGVRFGDDVILRQGWAPRLPPTCRFIRIPFSQGGDSPLIGLIVRNSQLSAVNFETRSQIGGSCSAMLGRVRNLRIDAGVVMHTAAPAMNLEELDVATRQTHLTSLQAAVRAAKKLQKLTVRIGRGGLVHGDVVGLLGVLPGSIKTVRIALVDTDASPFIRQLSTGLTTTRAFQLVVAASRGDLDGADAVISQLRVRWAAIGMRLVTAAI